jgi:ketosteroid isomerase-like protein
MATSTGTPDPEGARDREYVPAGRQEWLHHGGKLGQSQRGELIAESEAAAAHSPTPATLLSEPATLHPMTHGAATAAQVRELDITIDTAISGRDAATLDRLLADDFVYTHANGTPEPKREFIATAMARVDPPGRSLHGLQVEQHGEVAVTRGTIEFIYADARPNLYLGYVRVHRLLEGGWRAISHRSFHVVDRG